MYETSFVIVAMRSYLLSIFADYVLKCFLSVSSYLTLQAKGTYCGEFFGTYRQSLMQLQQK